MAPTLARRRSAATPRRRGGLPAVLAAATAAAAAVALAGAAFSVPPAPTSPLLAELLGLAGSEPDASKVAARVDADFGRLGPEDLKSLQAQLASAEGEAEKKPREVLTQCIQASMEKRMERATADISALLASSGDVNQNIKDCLAKQDSPLPIMTVLQMNLAKAETGSQQQKALRYILNVMTEELDKKVPTVLKVLSSLLTTEESAVRRRILKDHLAAEGTAEAAKELSSAIVTLVQDSEVQFRSQKIEPAQRIETLELIRRTAIDAGVVVAEVYGDEEQDAFTDGLGPLFEALTRE